MLKTTERGTKDWKESTFPKVSGKKAYVLPGAFFGHCVLLMAEAGYTKANSVEEADVVVFVGGEDINPVLYDQKAVCSYFNRSRDDYEISVYKEAQALGKVCFGICRGAQFLHAMNGGQLWQDVNNHAGKNHLIIDLDEDVRVEVTSMHHQMLQDSDNLEIIAVTEHQVATSFLDENLHLTGDNANNEVEIEAGCYHDTKCFFVQGHPEVGSVYYKTWTMTKLFVLMNEWASKEQLKETVSNMKVTG
jgi:gamma-glutamyl-gamma-aminobutyrate hydrolase PuuD